MIILIILLIGVIIYYYNTNSLYEKFISENISIDDIVNNPSKTQNYINSDNRTSIADVFKKNVDLDYLKQSSGLDIIKDMAVKLNNLSPAQKKTMKEMVTNQLAPIASRMNGKIKIPVTDNETNRIPDMLSTSMDHILPARNLDMVQNKQPEKKEYFNYFII